MRRSALPLRFIQTQPDARLAALAQGGSEVAFEVLVRRYRSELLAYCRRHESQGLCAEDLVQLTFLHAWRALSSGVEVREIRPWLYRIAHNAAVSAARPHTLVPCALEEAQDKQEIFQTVEHRLQARATLGHLAGLPIPQRQAIVGSSLQGASHEEIAQALGVTTASVRGLIYRARASLRAAAAAVLPGPVFGWLLRHLETGQAPSGQLIEGIGGGTGLAAAFIKGGLVLGVLGTAALPGVVIEAHLHHHHRHAARRLTTLSARGQGVRQGPGAISAALSSQRTPASFSVALNATSRARPGQRAVQLLGHPSMRNSTGSANTVNQRPAAAPGAGREPRRRGDNSGDQGSRRGPSPQTVDEIDATRGGSNESLPTTLSGSNGNGTSGGGGGGSGRGPGSGSGGAPLRLRCLTARSRVTSRRRRRAAVATAPARGTAGAVLVRVMRRHDSSADRPSSRGRTTKVQFS